MTNEQATKQQQITNAIHALNLVVGNEKTTDSVRKEANEKISKLIEQIS